MTRTKMFMTDLNIPTTNNFVNMILYYVKRFD